MWMLDDGPLGSLASLAPQVAHWPKESLHVAESVREGAHRDKSGRRPALLAAKGNGGPLFVAHEVLADTPAWDMLYSHLRKGTTSTTADLGEHESIAICATQCTQLVFVCQDRRATQIALSELGRGRVASPFACWDDLRQNGLVDDAAFVALCRLSLRGDSGLPGVPWRFRA
jgi:hypothetical protein